MKLTNEQMETLAVRHLALDADFTITKRGPSLDFHDFHEVSVSGLERLMQAVYELGQEAAAEPVPEYASLPRRVATAYASQINRFHDIAATADEVTTAYRLSFAGKFDQKGQPYPLTFFFTDGEWVDYLDSEDRLTLALTIENTVRLFCAEVV